MNLNYIDLAKCTKSGLNILPPMHRLSGTASQIPSVTKSVVFT